MSENTFFKLYSYSKSNKLMVATLLLMTYLLSSHAWADASNTAVKSPAPTTAGMPATQPGAAPLPLQEALHEQPTSPEFLPDENKMTLTQQQQNVSAYINKMNKLQSLKLEREIAELSKDISAANLATASSDKKLSELLVPSTGGFESKPAPSMTPGALPPISTIQSTNEKNMEMEKSLNDYSIVSISMQLDKWTAVLNYRGKLYSVHVGDILPSNHFMITNISNDGVTLTKNKKSVKINMISSI